MKLARLIHAALAGRILLVVLTILFTLCVGPVNAASEPGTVTIVIGSEPVNLDPYYGTRSETGQVMAKNIMETLTEISPTDSSITPRLATSWKQIDAHTWHFFLRKGVKFHDGKDFNADAVVFNIERIYDKRVESPLRAKFLAHFKMQGKRLDSHTLEVKTDKPEPLLLTLMGVLPMCSPNTPSGKFSRNPIGTGPYKFVKWDAGTQIILERFDGYWGKQPPVKKAIYVWRNESAVRASMVSIGEADLAPEIAAHEANQPDMDYSYFDSTTSFFQIGLEEPPLNDRRVRMALNYAVDKNAIRGSIFSKDVVPATQVIGPSIFGYNPQIEVWPYDPQKAKQLLAEARKDGVPVDKEILLVGRIGYFVNIAELMEALMSMYKAVGLNIKIRMLEAGAFQPYSSKPYPKNVGPYIVAGNHDNSFGDAVFTMFTFYHCQGGKSHGCDKVLDDLIEKAQVAAGEARKNFWWAVAKRNYEGIPDVILFQMVAYARVGKRINFKPNLMTKREVPLERMTFK